MFPYLFFYAERCTARYLFWKTLPGGDLIYDLSILFAFPSLQVGKQKRLKKFGLCFFFVFCHSSQFIFQSMRFFPYIISLDCFIGKKKISILFDKKHGFGQWGTVKRGCWWSCGCPDVCVVAFGKKIWAHWKACLSCICVPYEIYTFPCQRCEEQTLRIQKRDFDF